MSPTLVRLINEVLDQAGAKTNRDQLTKIFNTVVRLAASNAQRLDLKITSAALTELTEAFRIFSPYRLVPKVTIFGSARTLPDHPLYLQARDFAARMASHNWMVVTGAGPGIMAAGLEGAGREHSFGINIRLPMENEANAFIASDPKLVEMKYFFTRKLMLMKESDAFVVLPGGFGTQDEAFELLTLIQTGKAEPSPIVLLDIPGGTYWKAWSHFISSELIGRGFVSDQDKALYKVTDDVDVTTKEVLGFYRNYHSRRFVGDILIIRLRQAPNASQLIELSEKFSDICDQAGIQRSSPTTAENAEGDHLELDRISLRFDRIHNGRLRELIDELNLLGEVV